MFVEFEKISGLALNIKKTVFIPLWPASSLSNVATLIKEACPRWKDVGVEWCAKYLGFFIGPGARDKSWEKPIHKYNQRVELWASMRLGLLLNILV